MLNSAPSRCADTPPPGWRVQLQAFLAVSFLFCALHFSTLTDCILVLLDGILILFGSHFSIFWDCIFNTKMKTSQDYILVFFGFHFSTFLSHILVLFRSILVLFGLHFSTFMDRTSFLLDVHVD